MRLTLRPTRSVHPATRNPPNEATDAEMYALYVSRGVVAAAKAHRISPELVRRACKRHSLRTGDAYPISHQKMAPEQGYAALVAGLGWEAAREASGYSTVGSCIASIRRWAIENGSQWPPPKRSRTKLSEAERAERARVRARESYYRKKAKAG